MASHSPLHAKDAFTEEALKRISATVAEVEQHTSAEIRVSIHDERESDQSGLPIEKIGEQEFFKLGMEKTKLRNGILLLIIYAERKFYVHGDEGIHSRVDPGTWTDVADVLKSNFSHGHFEEGIHTALKTISKHLMTALPSTGDSTNELSNDVVIR